MADVGVGIADIDGVATGGPTPMEVSHYLGIAPRWVDNTIVGGCTFMLHVRHAAAAIASGAATTVLITHGEPGRSRLGMQRYSAMVTDTASGQFEAPYGALPPYATFTVPALRFLHERGMSRTDLAEVVVAQREWAMRTPRAFRRPHRDACRPPRPDAGGRRGGSGNALRPVERGDGDIARPAPARPRAGGAVAAPVALAQVRPGRVHSAVPPRDPLRP
jgi:hypothetical protein